MALDTSKRITRSSLQTKIDQLESQSRRDHLIKGKASESWEQTESKVKDFITNKLDLDVAMTTKQTFQHLKIQNIPQYFQNILFSNVPFLCKINITYCIKHDEYIALETQS